MSKEKFESEMAFMKNNQFYLFYEMMVQSLKTDNVSKGINKSLSLLRNYLNSGIIILFSKSNGSSYVYNKSDSNDNNLIQVIGCVVNKIDIQKKEFYYLPLNSSDNFQNIMLFHMIIEDTNYIMAITNLQEKIELESLFWERLKETMQIILKRAASYERNIKAITTDLLTGLDNRNSYEMRLQKLNEADEQLIYGIFDLFRLKYVNDNYSHNIGDNYIKGAANILSKYWPKEKTIVDSNGIEKHLETGHCIYRIGGDEFALLSNSDDLSISNMKAQLAANEIGLIDLGIKEKCPTGLNYGVVHHIPGDYMKNTVARAEEIMHENKRKMYLKYNIERRK